MDDGTRDPAPDRDDDAEPEESPEPSKARPEDGERQPERIAYFIRQLSDDNEVTRWRSAEILGRIGDPAAVDALIDTLWDDDARVRLKSAWALGAIGDVRAVPALRRLYRMERENIQEIIKEALEEINRKSGPGGSNRDY